MSLDDMAIDPGWAPIRQRLLTLPPPNWPAEVLHLVRALLGLPDVGTTCAESQAWVPSYVDTEIEEGGAGQRFPAVKRHLDLCWGCGENYLALLVLMLLADREGLPEPPPLAPPDLGFLSS